jgi:hypothetical protein
MTDEKENEETLRRALHASASSQQPAPHPTLIYTMGEMNMRDPSDSSASHDYTAARTRRVLGVLSTFSRTWEKKTLCRKPTPQKRR